MAVSMEIRRKVIAALQRGESGASIARRFEISGKTVTRLKQKHEAGDTLTPGKPGPRGPVKLSAADHALMREQVARKPGITARELMPMLSTLVVESTVCRALRRLGLRLKKSRSSPPSSVGPMWPSVGCTSRLPAGSPSLSVSCSSMNRGRRRT